MDGKHVLAVDYVWNEIAETKSPRIEGDDLGAYALAAASDHLVRYALADLRSALESPDDTGFYCYRAIESIRHNYTEESDKGDGDSWKRLREDLDVPRSEIDAFKMRADDRRHGRQLRAVSEDERRSALLTARKVVKRYVYRDRRDSWLIYSPACDGFATGRKGQAFAANAASSITGGSRTTAWRRSDRSGAPPWSSYPDPANSTTGVAASTATATHPRSGTCSTRCSDSSTTACKPTSPTTR